MVDSPSMSDLPANDPACLDVDRPAVDLVIQGRPRDLGTVVVSRILPAARRRMVGPFVFLDHMGPVELAPGVGFDVRPHPHIGLSTVTYFLAGTNVHRDNLGTVQVNRPLDLNLMTAGRGVVHSERAEPSFRATGGVMHGLQIWLALPDAHEDDEPSFEHHPAATLPVIAPAAGARGRVLLGTAFGATSPVVHPSEPWLVDLELDPGARVEVPTGPPERGVFVVEGALDAGGQLLGQNELGVLGDAAVPVVAIERTRLLLLGGPSPGPRLLEWNFVASTRERIDRARDAWRRQDYVRIPTDADEFIPLPA